MARGRKTPLSAGKADDVDTTAQPSFYRNKRVAVDSIDGDELKAYARSLGITQRDVDGLTQDRLRQNCKARIAESMSD